MDNLNDYYDPRLKHDRLKLLQNNDNFRFFEADISISEQLEASFTNINPDCVVHLAAQAGVQYSLENPNAYVSSNLVGFVNLLEILRARGGPHLIYASTSSVYGGNEKIPFQEKDVTDRPLTLYAATKKIQ